MKPRWTVGCIQDGPLHAAGLRWFIMGSAMDYAIGSHPVAWTIERDEADRIVASLEATRVDVSTG